MRFLRKDKIKKTILVISDLHLGAGVIIDNKRNYLEDFHHDREFVELIEYYSTGEYQGREIQLIINGDFLDFLSVPFVKFFDDEYWSEKASVARLEMIIEGHIEVFEALRQFISKKNHTITYILGNHDAEMVLDETKEYFFSFFPEETRKNITLLSNDGGEYIPIEGVYLVHGHEYETAHYYHSKKSIIRDENGIKYFLPPWASYYVTRVVNKFRDEKSYVNAVKPVRKFIINGLIYDTLFTLRFCFATLWYFIMVRFLYFYRQHRKFKKIVEHAKKELELFKDYEEITEEFFDKRPGIKALIVGHTHEPAIRPRSDGSLFINTGTWTKTFNLDFGKRAEGIRLTYAQIDIQANDSKGIDQEFDISLNKWKGINNLPYSEL